MTRPFKTARRTTLRHLVLAGVVLALPFTAPAKAEDAKPADTSRLVSIGGAVTEIIYALGEEGRLVARDSTSLYPEAVTKLPDVGYMRALSPEGVLAVNPSAIIAIEGSGPPEALSVLKSASVPFATVPETFDRDGILKKIDAVGAFLNVEDKAKKLEESVAADLDAAIAEAAKRPESERKRVIFILSMQNGRVMASGTGTAADGILKLSGLVNAVGTFPGYKPLTDEAIIEAKPDVILMMERGGNHDAGVQEIIAHPALGLTPAAQNKAIIRMDGLHMLGFGPRTASAVRALTKSVYGG
ncbi:hemin ABC transporter substrate-binding protein [Rhizobium sp. LjRoot30]|uniref:heme/hemin ABC transporter substrate-binding protein n=1 Tax=Rhizobium sp. LjRoot30 TaxID=3342320 RepID=UPI003ECF1FED